jgi:hypothetical protein
MDDNILRAALIGYQSELDRIARAIGDIRARLGGGGNSPTRFTEPAKKRWNMSAAARKRIGAAQKKRWAAFHKQNGAK